MVASSEPLPICLVGLGQMGAPIAQRLLRAGFDVRATDKSAEARERFASAGGLPFEEPAEAVRGASAVITLLPNGPVVREALLGSSGVLSGTVSSDLLIIEMSSSAPSDTLALGSELGLRGISLVDAPVSGGVKRAVEGKLTVMMGGPEEACRRAQSILQPVASAIHRTGGLATGHAAKAINNYVSACGTASAMEAVLLGQRFGIEPGVLVDVLNGSSGRNNATEVKMRQFVLSESFASGFALGLMAKDVGIAADMALTERLELPLLAEVANLWKQAAVSLSDRADHTEMMKFIKEFAGRNGR